MHACRIDRVVTVGVTSPVSSSAPIPTGDGAVEDQDELPGQQIGMARLALFGLGAEEDGQILLAPASHPACRAALALEPHLSSQETVGFAGRTEAAVVVHHPSVVHHHSRSGKAS